ncbi:MAG: hypothetical protein ACXQTD_07420 [Candidatus Syntropharchaeia archaeon]
MALVEPYMGKHVTLASGTNFELEADPGEAFLVKDIHVYNPANSYIKVLIDKVTVGYFRVKGDLGNHLSFVSGVNYDTQGNGKAYDYRGKKVNETLLGYLRRIGVFDGYPIAEGQKLTIMEDGSSTQQAEIYVEYEKYEPGDISSDMPNGSEGVEYMFVNYGQPSSALAVDTTTEVDNMISPTEFPKFPFEDAVPARTEIEIACVLGSPVSVAGDASNYGIRTKYLKFQREREVLFDEDRNGLLFWQTDYGASANDLRVGGGMSVVGNKSDVDQNDGFEKLRGRVFRAGEDLDIYITTGHIGSTEGTPKTISVARAEIALVEIVRRVE